MPLPAEAADTVGLIGRTSAAGSFLTMVTEARGTLRAWGYVCKHTFVGSPAGSLRGQGWRKMLDVPELFLW